MNLFVLDASVLVASEDPDDRSHEEARLLLAIDKRLGTLDLAFYEVTNVAVCAWSDAGAAERLRERVLALAGDGGLIRADAPLLSAAAAIARDHGISVYDAAYVAGSVRVEAQLVSCDVRDLVGRGLAILPGDVPAVRAARGR